MFNHRQRYRALYLYRRKTIYYIQYHIHNTKVADIAFIAKQTPDTAFEEHLLDKQFICRNNCNIELPADGAVMKFKNCKNILQRP